MFAVILAMVDTQRKHLMVTVHLTKQQQEQAEAPASLIG